MVSAITAIVIASCLTMALVINNISHNIMEDNAKTILTQASIRNANLIKEHFAELFVATQTAHGIINASFKSDAHLDYRWMLRLPSLAGNPAATRGEFFRKPTKSMFTLTKTRKPLSGVQEESILQTV